MKKKVFLFSIHLTELLLLPVKPGGQSQWKGSACPANRVQVPPWAQVFGLQAGSRWLHCCPDQPGSHSQ